MINIYVGENGSGKSRLLGEIAKKAINNEQPVIAIATANNDKFPRRTTKGNYHYMGTRVGRFYARDAIKNAFIEHYKNNESDYAQDVMIRALYKILNYAEFEQSVGLEIVGMSDNPYWDFNDFLEYSEYELNEILLEGDLKNNLLSELKFLTNYLGKSNYNKTLWIDNVSDFSRMNVVRVFSTLILHEKLLKKAKVIKSLKVILRKKNGLEIPVDEASSGELSLISTAIFIASNLSVNSYFNTVLIDEPENSLHPEWQRKYISNLLDIFEFFDIEYHIATHSPLFIAGASKESNVKVHRYNGESFDVVESNVTNIEDALIDQFGIVTPQSNALSERCIDIINDVDSGTLSKNTAYITLKEFKKASYDDKQKAFINGVIDIIKKLNN